MIAGIVVLYEPDMDRLKTISEYCQVVDRFFIIDNSENDNYSRIATVFDKSVEKIVIGESLNGIGYLHCGKNIGLCAAFNLGMKAAKGNGCNWTLLMDDDSKLGTNVIEVYRKLLDVDNIAVLAPVHLHDTSKAKAYTGTRDIKWAMTSGCLYNNRIFDKLNGFKEELFVDGLDIDYCYKAYEAGYRVVECGEATINHHPSETRDLQILGRTIIKYGYSSPWRYQMQIRSLVWTILRYRHFKDVVMYLWKWAKAIAFFENKREYFRRMKEGHREGNALYKKYVGAKQ